MADDLDHQIRDHYHAITAPEAVRSRLVALAVDRTAQGRQVRRYAWGGLAAAVLVATLFLWAMAEPRYAGPAEIAASVAAHHLHQQASDVVSNRVEDIAQALPNLDFTLRLPQRDGLPAWRIEGGRYCSIAGNIAAQLRLSDARGGRHTLYVSRCIGAVADIDSFSTDIDSVAVRIWRDRDLTFAWATATR